MYFTTVLKQTLTSVCSLMSFCFAQAGLKAGLSTNEVEEILNLAKSQPIKDKLKSVTQEALDYQVGAVLLLLCTLCFSNQNVPYSDIPSHFCSALVFRALCVM